MQESSKTLIPDAFEKFDAKRQELSRLMAYYRCAMMEIETKFKVLNEERLSVWERNPIENIKCRLKSPESIFEKLVRRNLPLTISSIEQNLTDVAGVRVICEFIEDVYELADVLLKQDDISLVIKKDYIKDPKPNGYRSLHLIVKTPIFLADGKKDMNVEIQFRTIAMDFWASLEHDLNYKKGYHLPAEISEELLACASLSASLDARMNALKNRVLEERKEGESRGELKALLEALLSSRIS